MDTNGTFDVYVRDLVLGTTMLASKTTGGLVGNAASIEPSIAGTGRFVAFRSPATNLVPGDTNGVADIFVHDMVSGITLRASESTLGVQGNQSSITASISADGRSVVYQSLADNLVSGDTNGKYDVFLTELPPFP